MNDLPLKSLRIGNASFMRRSLKRDAYHAALFMREVARLMAKEYR